MDHSDSINEEALRARINADLQDGLDEELELELEESRLDPFIAAQLKHEPRDSMDRKLYFRELLRLQGELVKLQDWVQHHKLKVVVIFEGRDLASLDAETLRRTRTRLHMIFQDPISSLNPRRKVRDIVAEPMAIAGMGSAEERRRRVRAALEAVGLDPDQVMDRRPHEFSGGQCQRIAIARALVTEPHLVICDEPVSALDVSVRAQILNLLEDMKARYGLTLLFISHDLAVVKNISDRVAVMYLGRLCELAPSARLYEAPLHPYTAALMAAIPVMDPDRRPSPSQLLAGELPSPMNPPSGCRFRTRCPRAAPLCAAREPQWQEAEADHFVACHFPLVASEGATISSPRQP